MAIDLDELLAPIRGDDPCGEDASFSDLFDRIREARRYDDPDLPRGEWETELKVADWRLALDLATQAMTKHSKDLQAAAWLGEAAISRFGLDGAKDAFALITGLVENYWDGFWPRAEDGDLEERAGKLAWFNTYAGQALMRVPLTTDGGPPLSLAEWKQSREVDNLARQNAEAYKEAVGEGKLTGEAFDTRIMASPDDALRTLHAQAEAAQAEFAKMKSTLDARFGREGASLAAIEDALKGIRNVLTKAAQAKGLLTEASVEEAMSESGGEGAPAASGGGGGGGRLDLSANAAASKDAALRALGEISVFFKRTEPHSPVGFLLERALQWANMPLDQWLQEVCNDDSVLNMIRDRSGMPRV